MARLLKPNEASAKKEKNKLKEGTMPKKLQKGTTSLENIKGTILMDIAKDQGRIGLEEIKAVVLKCEKISQDVVKCENNGYELLFAKLYTYLRNTKLNDMQIVKGMYGSKLLVPQNGFDLNTNESTHKYLFKYCGMLKVIQLINVTKIGTIHIDLKAGLGKPVDFRAVKFRVELTNDGDRDYASQSALQGMNTRCSDLKIVKMNWSKKDVNSSLLPFVAKDVPISVDDSKNKFMEWIMDNERKLGITSSNFHKYYKNDGKNTLKSPRFRGHRIEKSKYKSQGFKSAVLKIKMRRHTDPTVPMNFVWMPISRVM